MSFAPPFNANQRLLALTSLKPILPEAGVDVFLGEWCFGFPEDAQLAHRADVADYPWTSPEARIRGAKFCLAITRRLVNGLTPFFSELLHDELGEREATLLLCRTLGLLVQTAHHHFICLQSAIEKFGPLRSYGLRREDYVVPETTKTLVALLHREELHLQLFSDLCPSLGIPLALYSRRELSAACASGLTTTHRRRRGSVGRWLREAIKIFVKLGARRAHCVLYDSSFSMGETIVLAARSGFRIAQLPLVRLDTVAWSSPSVELRREFANRIGAILGATPFEKALGNILTWACPITLLEGLDTLKTTVATYFPPRPRTIASGMAWPFDDAFKLWCVQSLKQGAQLVSTQHGGGYGMRHPIDLAEHTEYSIVDRFIGWGGSGFHALSCKTLPVPPHFLTKGARNNRKEILYVGTVAGRWPEVIGAYPMGSMFLQYISRQIAFWHALSPDLQAHFLFRPNPDDVGWRAAERLRDAVPQLLIDDFSESFSKRLRAARLVVVDNLNTTFLQSMGSGIPTILVWDPKVWLTNDIAQTHFDTLEAAGVYFRSPEAAAKAVAPIWEDPQSWWESPRVSLPVNNFLDHYFRRDDAWSPLWVHELLN